MGELKTYIIGTILFMAVITGVFYSMNDWLSNTGATQATDSITGNFTAPTNYLNNWVNRTQASISTAQAVPLIGIGLVLLTGVFQSITLLVGLPTNVILPVFNTIMQYLGAPAWVAPVIMLIIFVSVLVAIMNAMKGGAI